MKKLLFFTILFLTILLISRFADSAVNGGTIVTTVVNNTNVLVQMTTKASTADSVYICRMYPGSSDTTFLALIDTTIVNRLMSSQVPGRQSIYFVLARDGAGHTAISDKDTVTVYSPEIGEETSSNIMRKVEKVITATSWRPYNPTESFTLSGSAAKDSSGVYEPWKNNTLVAVASQAGDSVKAIVYITYGYREMTQLGNWIGFTVPLDSLAITSSGVFKKSFTVNLAYPSMYFTFGSYAGNGKNSSIALYLTRDRY